MYLPVRNPYVNNQRSNVPLFCIFFVGLLSLVVIFACVIPSVMSNEDILKLPYLKSATSANNREISMAFADFTKTYGKAYATAEEAELRRKTFEFNYRKIAEHNKQPHKTCTLEINKFADLSDEEFARMYLSKPKIPPMIEIDQKDAKAIDPSLNVNWVAEGKVPKVKDQGMCGSCWTFGSTSVVETIVAIRTKSAPNRYSEQQLVDCCIAPESHGCDGGETTDAFKHMMDKGIALESQYPYTAIDEECKLDKVPTHVKLDGYVNISAGNNTWMEAAIKTRTMAIGVSAGPFNFRFYKSGVVTSDCEYKHLSHEVTIVGASTEKVNGVDVPYWYIRNSWGPNWGINGYIKIARTQDGDPGVCGVSLAAQYVLYKEA